MARAYKSVVLGGGTPRACPTDWSSYNVWTEWYLSCRAADHMDLLKEGGIVVKTQPWTGRKVCSVCRVVCWNVTTEGGMHAHMTHEEDARRRLERKTKKENKLRAQSYKAVSL